MQTIARYTKQFIQYVRKNSAVSALEYAILIGVISVAIAAVLSQLGDSVESAIGEAKTKVNQARTAAGLKGSN